MSNQERHEAPAKAITERHSFKLELRKRTVEKFIWNKRHPNAGIKGYDLSKFKRKPNKGKKSCWWCGSNHHLIASCPSHKISLLKSRVTELEARIEELESAMVIKENNKKKLMRKKKKKEAGCESNGYCGENQMPPPHGRKVVEWSRLVETPT